MSRLAFLLPLFLTGAVLAAQPPKEPTYDGKVLSEWVKLLASKDEAEQQKAVTALRALGGQSDAVAEKLLAAATDPNNPRANLILQTVVELGPAAVPAATRGLWSEDKFARLLCLRTLGAIGPDGLSAAPSVARLLADPDENIRSASAVALGMMNAHHAVPALAKALDERDPHTRLTIAAALARLGAESKVVIPAVTELLKHADPVVRSRAVGILGYLGPEAAAAVPALVAQLSAPDADMLQLLRTFESIGPGAKDAAAAIKKRLADDKEKAGAYRAEAAAALWVIARDPEAVKLLRQELADTGRPTAVVSVLWRIDSGPETVAALAELLKSARPELAIPAAGALGSKAKDAVPLLGKMLAHKDPNVRARAVVALNRLGPAAKEAAEALRGAAKDESPLIAFWANVALCRLDPKPEAVAAVAGYLADRDPSLRLDAAEVIGLLGAAGKRAVPKLTILPPDTDEYFRLASAVALWRVEQHFIALPTAVALLRSSDPRIRSLAAIDIGGVFGADAKSAVPDLVKRLFDPFSRVRSSAAEALGRIGTAAKPAAPALLALLEGDEPGFVQSAACEALGLIQPTDKDGTVAVLKKKLDHPDPLVRAHAGLALFIVAEDKAGEKEAERGLGHRTHPVRITAAEALWRMRQDARAVPLLVRALEESNLEDRPGEDNERYMAARALGRVGSAAKPAVPELLKLVNHADAALAATAAESVKAIDPDAAKKAGLK
jgi:HEAT repeat protein